MPDSQLVLLAGGLALAGAAGYYLITKYISGPDAYHQSLMDKLSFWDVQGNTEVSLVPKFVFKGYSTKLGRAKAPHSTWLLLAKGADYNDPEGICDLWGFEGQVSAEMSRLTSLTIRVYFDDRLIATLDGAVPYTVVDIG